ncbi:MAG: TlpA family protein disulfide reductase [Fimbriimonadia bacterium]
MPLRAGAPMPSFDGATEWLNGSPDPESLASGPAFVAFWSVSCHICHENMPAVREWKKLYEPRGLRFISVHMPRQPEDTNVERVREMVAEFGIDEPCAIDNNHAIADAFENEWVPSYYLFDSDGKMKARSAGVYAVKMMTLPLQKLFE